MKKFIYMPVIVLLAISTATIVVSCKPSDKEKEAQEKVDVAKEDLAEARQQANQEEWQSFKNDMNVVIEKNDIRIQELKQSMKESGKSANAEYEKKVEALTKKNDALKEKMDNYKNDANSNWQSFKREFNHDTDELAKALKDFTVNNKK